MTVRPQDRIQAMAAARVALIEFFEISRSHGLGDVVVSPTLYDDLADLIGCDEREVRAWARPGLLHFSDGRATILQGRT